MSTDNAVSLNGTATTWPEVLTLAEAAAFVRLSEATLQQEAVAKRLPGRYLEGQWRFTRQGLLDWVNTPNAQDDSQEHLLALAGIWENDPTAEAMIEEIGRKRKRHPIGEPY